MPSYFTFATLARPVNVNELKCLAMPTSSGSPWAIVRGLEVIGAVCNGVKRYNITAKVRTRSQLTMRPLKTDHFLRLVSAFFQIFIQTSKAEDLATATITSSSGIAQLITGKSTLLLEGSVVLHFKYSS